MTSHIISHPINVTEMDRFLGDDWFDPLEAGVRTRIRAFIEDLLEAELEAALGRRRYERRCPSQPHAAGQDATAPAGYRHGHRERSLLGTLGPVMVRVPRARLVNPEGSTREWKNATLPVYSWVREATYCLSEQDLTTAVLHKARCRVFGAIKG